MSGQPVILVGNTIVVSSVCPPKLLIYYCGILKRDNYLSFSWKSKKRKGALSEAYIEETVSGEMISHRFLPLEDFKNYIKNKHLKIFGKDLPVSCCGTLFGKILIGECSSYKINLIKGSARHHANQTVMSCSKSLASLCYSDTTYSEDTKFVIS